MLAIRRGEAEGMLKVGLDLPEPETLQMLERIFVKADNESAIRVKMAVKDAYKRLLFPSIESEYLAWGKQKADEIIASIRELVPSFKIKIYDEDSEYGLLRHVMVRVAPATGEIMVVLVLGSPILPSKKNFVNELCKLHPEITTILINVNNKRTSMVLGEKEQVIYGKGYIEDELCGRRFKISAKSFYQVNPAQTEILYKKAIKLSASIITRFLFQRSIKIPVNSPNTDCGSMAAMAAKTNTSADFVSKLSHRMIAKLTIELVRIEKN